MRQADYPDEQLLVAMRGQEILGGATMSLVCDGRGLWCSQIEQSAPQWRRHGNGGRDVSPGS